MNAVLISIANMCYVMSFFLFIFVAGAACGLIFWYIIGLIISKYIRWYNNRKVKQGEPHEQWRI